MVAYLRGPDIVAGYITAFAGTDGPTIMFLLVCVFVIVGDFIDAMPAIIIFMPIINKLTEIGNINAAAHGRGHHPTLVFGLITPPYGLSLLIASKFVDVGFGKAGALTAALHRLLPHDRLHRLLPGGRALAPEECCRNPSAASSRPGTGYICPREAPIGARPCALAVSSPRPVPRFAPLTPQPRRRHSGPRSRELSVAPDVFRALYDAFLRYLVLLFPPARSCRPRHRSRSRAIFGEVQVHVMTMYHADGFPELYRLSNLNADGKPDGKHPDRGTLYWHTDGSWQPRHRPGDDHLRRGRARASAARRTSATCTAPTSG